MGISLLAATVISQASVVGYQYIQYYRKSRLLSIEARYNPLDYWDQIKTLGTGFIKDVNGIMCSPGMITLEKLQNAVTAQLGPQSAQNRYIVKLMYNKMITASDDTDEIILVMSADEDALPYLYKTVGYTSVIALPLFIDQYRTEIQQSYVQIKEKLSKAGEALAIDINLCIAAYKAGAPLIRVFQFSNYVQVEAIKRHIPIADALQLSNYWQISAIEAGVPLEDALKFQNCAQFKAFKAGATIENAIKSQSYNTQAPEFPTTPEEPWLSGSHASEHEQI